MPRERIVHPAPANCPCCGGNRLRKIGEDVTETLELVPRQWKVIQHVREKVSSRACEAITQPPAPFHPIARGRAGPRLLAHILFAKYGLHLPLTRQSTTYGHEGVAQRLDAGLLGWRSSCDLDAAGRGDQGACPHCRAHPCRRHHGAGSGQGQDAHGARLDLCARQSALRRARAAGSLVLLLARPLRHPSRGASCDLCRTDAGGRLCRLTGSTIHRGSRARSLRSVAGRMHGANSSRSHG
ncbi:putative transposase [Bradyrhizobium sp. ORS 285]|nr:putative transposase [Bradyrhizobium sp. ORS 285]